MKSREGEVLKAFNHLYKEMDAYYHAIAVKLGLSDSAFDILYQICALGSGCRQKDICMMSVISKQTINSSIRRLEQEGILCLKSGRGRDMHIFLTEEGEKFVTEKVLPVIECENAAFEAMSKEEQHEIIRLLHKYLITFQKETREKGF